MFALECLFTLFPEAPSNQANNKSWRSNLYGKCEIILMIVCYMLGFFFQYFHINLWTILLINRQDVGLFRQQIKLLSGSIRCFLLYRLLNFVFFVRI